MTELRLECVADYVCFYQKNISDFIQLKLLVYKAEIWKLACAKTMLLTTVLFFKADWCHQFVVCTDIIAVDRPGKLYRFTVLYYLLSVIYNTRFVIYVQLRSLQAIFSVSMLYSAAKWGEREIWDLFGILFLAHPDLRRLLTDYGFNRFPLRKDFPITGYTELFFSDTLKSIIYTKVEIAQDVRISSILAPWSLKKR